MSNQTAYAELVSQAEQAVAGVKDAELRRVAFERVLDDLLANELRPQKGAGDQAAVRSAAGTKAGRKAKRGGRPTARPVRGGPQARIEELVGDHFFKKQRTISEVRAELGNRGHHIAMTSLSGPLQKLCQNKVLRRQKIDGPGGKKAFGYSNW